MKIMNSKHKAPQHCDSMDVRTSRSSSKSSSAFVQLPDQCPSPINTHRSPCLFSLQPRHANDTELPKVNGQAASFFSIALERDRRIVSKEFQCLLEPCFRRSMALQYGGHRRDGIDPKVCLMIIERPFLFVVFFFCSYKFCPTSDAKIKSGSFLTFRAC